MKKPRVVFDMRGAEVPEEIFRRASEAARPGAEAAYTRAMEAGVDPVILALRLAVGRYSAELKLTKTTKNL